MVERLPLVVFRFLVGGALVTPLILVPSSAPAGCAAPAIELRHATVTAGTTLVVRGEHWRSGCDDSGPPGDGGGCFGGDDPAASEQPYEGIQVSLVRNGVALQETTVDGPEFTVRILTEGLTPGDYGVRAEHDGEDVTEVLTVAPVDAN